MHGCHPATRPSSKAAPPGMRRASRARTSPCTHSGTLALTCAREVEQGGKKGRRTGPYASSQRSRSWLAPQCGRRCKSLSMRANTARESNRVALGAAVALTSFAVPGPQPCPRPPFPSPGRPRKRPAALPFPSPPTPRSEGPARLRARPTTGARKAIRHAGGPPTTGWRIWGAKRYRLSGIVRPPHVSSRLRFYVP